MMKIVERRETGYISYDKIYDGQTYHHTGYEVLTQANNGLRMWFLEYRNAETGEIEYV